MTNSENDVMIRFKTEPFSVLVKDVRELAALRRDYASMPADKRRMAADWEYHSEMASDIFNNAIALAGKEGLGKSI